MNEVAAVVVTYNRLELLKENIEALLNQSYKCDVILVDNASTDGTSEYVSSLNEKKILYFNTGKNLGGAGGFSYGAKKAEILGYRYFWLMDDDSVPLLDALDSIMKKVNKLENDFSFIASLVYWTDGKLFPMNVPKTMYSYKESMTVLDTISKKGLVPINNCSFVGCFVNTSVSRQVGLPIAEFFIYGDDMEYTNRLSREKQAYLDLNSIIIHKAPSNQGADITTASADRIERFFYQSRNGMYTAKKTGRIEMGRRFLVVCKRAFKIILFSKDHKLKRLRVLIKGTIQGLSFNPEIQYSSNGDE